MYIIFKMPIRDPRCLANKNHNFVHNYYQFAETTMASLSAATTSSEVKVKIFYDVNEISSADIAKVISNSNLKAMPALKDKKKLLTAIANKKDKIIDRVTMHCDIDPCLKDNIDKRIPSPRRIPTPTGKLVMILPCWDSSFLECRNSLAPQDQTEIS
jgi:hypothetical protein